MEWWSRFHLSAEYGPFDNVVPINLEQAQRICSEYRDYYNHYRPHQEIQGKAPETLHGREELAYMAAA